MPESISTTKEELLQRREKIVKMLAVDRAALAAMQGPVRKIWDRTPKSMRIGLTAVTLATGTGIVGYEKGWFGDHTPAGKVQPTNPKVEKNPFHTSGAENLSALIKPKTDTPPPSSKIEQPRETPLVTYKTPEPATENTPSPFAPEDTQPAILEVKQSAPPEVIQESRHTPRLGHEVTPTPPTSPKTVEEAKAAVLRNMGSTVNMERPETVTAPKVETELETAQRRIAEIKEKDRNNQAITPQDATDWNHYNYILKVAAEREAQMNAANAEREAKEAQRNAISPEVRTGREVRRPTSQPPRIIENGENVYGGAGNIWANNQYVDPYAPSRDIPAPNPVMEEMSTRESVEVERVYNANFEKIFPDGEKALSLWLKIQNKNAYKFMNRAGNKVPEEYKLLWTYLKQLEEVTKLPPKLEEKESVKEFMNRALGEAENQKKLDNVRLE